MNIIDKNIVKISELCEKYSVSKLYVFGSFINGKIKKTSDIDFLIDFKTSDLSDYADHYFDLKKSLEDLLNKQIDLLEDNAIKNPYLRQSIDTSKLLIYG